MSESMLDRIEHPSQIDSEPDSAPETYVDALLSFLVPVEGVDISELQNKDPLELRLALLEILERPEIARAASLSNTPTFEDIDAHKQLLLRDIAKLSWGRFEESWRAEYLDMSIAFVYKVPQQMPETNLDGPEWTSRLGASYQYRFKQLGSLEDLGKAVEFNWKAVFPTPDGHPDKPGRLSNLGASYQSLFKQLGRLDDLHKSVSHLEQAVFLTRDGHPDKPAMLSNLGTSYQSLFEQLGRLDDLHKSVSYKEQAVFLTRDGHPDKPAMLNNLGASYQSLFEQLGRLDDLHKSVSYKEQAVFLTRDGHPGKPAWLNNLGASYQSLFEQLGRLDDLHKSVSYKEQAVFLTQDGHPDKLAMLNNLGNSYQSLFEQLGRLDDLHKSVSYQEQAVFLTRDGHPDKPARLNNLGNSYRSLFKQLGRLDDLHKSVSHLEQAVFLTRDGHPDKPAWLNNLGISYWSLFEHLGQPKYASNAISCLMWASHSAPVDHPLQTGHLSQLGWVYWSMFQSSHLPAHALDALSHYKQAALVVTGSPAIRFRASHNWALLSQLCGLPPLEAYANSMTILPHVVWLGASAQDRYKCLATTQVGILATEAATAAISQTRYDLALEWLEQGRSIVWGQTLQLRTPYDELSTDHPDLAEELQYVSTQFEHASMSLSSGPSTACGGELPHETARKHRWLAQKREELIEYIRHLPGLEDFLRPPNASKIMSWVQDKTIVVVNVHELRCDALILQAGARDITHVPLTEFSVQKAKEARAELGRCLLGRGCQRGIKPDRRKLTFKDILELLWDEVVKPVLDHLGITHPLPVDDLPHITWCTTGPLSFLPLHAAGDYSSPSTVLPNLVISSYTPTVSALKKHTSSPTAFSGILTVGHESAIRGMNPLPGTRDELNRVQKHAKGLSFTRLDEKNACTDAVLQAMQDHSWVHLACHASQNKTDPTKSAFHLHDADLDLNTISRNPLKNAQFAFLSACQTATGDSDLPDESIHLAAGMLNTGFPTVIATMWSISDKDAPIVADKVYECLLEGGVPDSGKAAKALHKAVAGLRQQIGDDEFERWVPYIHIGR